MTTGSLPDKVTEIALAKLRLTPQEAFSRGVLCNILVCLAVWISVAARTAAGKVAVIILPISAFMGVGFEHSVANMYVLPVVMFGGNIVWDLSGLFLNLVYVTAGNIVGGSLFVAGAYWIVFIRNTA